MLKHRNLKNLKKKKKKHQYRHIRTTFKRLFYMHMDKLGKSKGQEKEKRNLLLYKTQIPFFFYNLTSGVSVVRLTSVAS